MKKNSYREQLLELKEEAWEAEDYQLVKEIRLKIKEFDAKQRQKEIKQMSLAEQLRLE